MSEDSPEVDAAHASGRLRGRRWRIAGFAATCIVAVALAGGYAAFSKWRVGHAATDVVAAAPITQLDTAVSPDSAAAPTVAEASPIPERDVAVGAASPGDARPTRPPSEAGGPTTALRTGAAPRAAVSPPPRQKPSIRPYVLFRNTALGDSYGRLGLEYLDVATDTRRIAPLSCDRVHYAAGRGLCLEAMRGVITTFYGHIFDHNFVIEHTFKLGGIPSRARMSPDGRLAAFTVFVSGHSYAGNDFSTRTSIVNAASGQVIVESLEDFVVLRDDAPIKAPDFNFWGVTFTREGNKFYATLATDGKFLLVAGDLATQTIRVLREGVECPSISPDNSKIAFKRRVGVGDRFGRFAWRLFVLNLSSGIEAELSSETRSVDDQVEWLDNRAIVYALPDSPKQATAATNTWTLASDGVGQPRLLIPFAFSPTVVR